MPREAKRQSTVRERLSWYWKVELGNALLVPLCVIYCCHEFGDGAGWMAWIAQVPMAALLILGGFYWRAKLRSLEGGEGALEPMLRIAVRVQGLLLLLALGVAGLVLAELLIVDLPGVTNTDLWAAGFCGILALLEYVNYYHRQLQHFDNWADFDRLITGRGLRPSKMAMDIAAMRRK